MSVQVPRPPKTAASPAPAAGAEAAVHANTTDRRTKTTPRRTGGFYGGVIRTLSTGGRSDAADAEPVRPHTRVQGQREADVVVERFRDCRLVSPGERPLHTHRQDHPSIQTLHDHACPSVVRRHPDLVKAAAELPLDPDLVAPDVWGRRPLLAIGQALRRLGTCREGSELTLHLRAEHVSPPDELGTRRRGGCGRDRRAGEEEDQREGSSPHAPDDNRVPACARSPSERG